MWVGSVNNLERYSKMKNIARSQFCKVEVAKSGDGDGEDHRPLHLAHRPLHPHRGGVHQPLHLPPYHLAHGGRWLSRCNSWVVNIVISFIVAMVK